MKKYSEELGCLQDTTIDGLYAKPDNFVCPDCLIDENKIIPVNQTSLSLIEINNSYQYRCTSNALVMRRYTGKRVASIIPILTPALASPVSAMVKDIVRGIPPTKSTSGVRPLSTPLTSLIQHVIALRGSD